MAHNFCYSWSELEQINFSDSSDHTKAAFTFHRSYQNNSMSGVDKEDQPGPNFHVVLQRIGKTVLRPGGSDATKKAQALANIHPGDTVLELSAGLGKSGIELARDYGAKVTLTDTDTSRLERAEELASKLGLSDQITVKKVDMFNIESSLGPDSKFDVAQIEASLTHYPRSRKAKFFQGVAKHADKFILHEVFFKTDDEELQELTKKDMSKVLNIGFVPETSDTWQKLLSDAGFTIDHVSTGDLALLNPISLIQDEGVAGFARISFNAATQPYLRKRMLATKSAISRHSKELGYITIIATKK
eukprot:481121_1